MSVEHRYTQRQPDHFEVTLSNPRYGTATARVENISPEGMALRLEDSPFPQGALLDMELPESRQALFHSCLVRGYVVYVQQDQIGLWLLEPSGDNIEAPAEDPD